MAGKTDTTATLFAQKKLLGKAHTSNLKIDVEEIIGSNIQTSTGLVFGDLIPNSPSQTLYQLQGVGGSSPDSVEYIQFVLNVLTGSTYDANSTGGGSGSDSGESLQTSGPHAYKFQLPSNYESLTSNTKAGNGVFDNNKLVHETLGQLQLIPPFYSQTAPNPYIIKIYKDDGSGGVGDEIPLLDNIDWSVDYYNGILFLQDYVSTKIPVYARAFAYVGRMASEVISSAQIASSGADSNATYLLYSATGSLPSARTFTSGLGINAVDSGAGSNYTIGIDNSVVATITGSIFTGDVKFEQGLSGSLTQLTDGTSYLVAGTNITIVSSSNGQITISSTATGGSGNPAGSNQQIQFNDNGSFGASSNLNFNDLNNTLSLTGSLGMKGNIIPDEDRTYNLGTAEKRWANIYTGDLHLKNDRGDYTLIEEEDMLTIRFNKSGKRYKFILERVPELDEIFTKK